MPGHAALDAVAAQPLQIAANGLTFACDSLGSGDSVALLLHGFPENRFSWRAQLPLLAARGWRAVAPDLRGYGGSSRPGPRDAYRLELLIEDVAALFDALGAKRRILIAHDWGAIIAWQFAIARRLELDALIIMNVPHPAVAARVVARPSRQWLRSWYMLFFQLPWLPEFVMSLNRAWVIGEVFRGMAVDKSRFPADVLDHYRNAAVRPGALRAMVNYYRANLRDVTRMANPAPLEVPTLMIWGEEDSALGLELTEGYAPYVRDFTLHRLPRVSHWVQQEAPEQVNALMQQWLDQRGMSPGQGAAPGGPPP